MSFHIGSEVILCNDHYNFFFQLRIPAVNHLLISDINECATGLHLCDINADCNNTFGNYTCHCRDDFFEDGMKCAGSTIIM